MDPKLLSLQQLSSLADTLTNDTINSDTPKIVTYLYPNALVAILIMLFVVGILIFAFLLLWDVQTPLGFPTDKIDFGKIEK